LFVFDDGQGYYGNMENYVFVLMFDMIAWMQTATIVFFATTPSRSMIVLAIEP
jgi:hypothetical protein